MFIQVLETVQRKEKRIWKKTWLCKANSSSGLAHRTVSGALGWPTVNRLLSGIDGVVRLKFTGLSGESSTTNSSLSGNEKGNVAKIHRTVR
jgi:hypothetical protein